MTNLIRLSQAHLNLLEVCPPRFKQVYLEGLSSIPDPEHQESLAWGSRFHQLMQQRELGLPIEPLLATDSELESSVKALLQAAPDVLSSTSDRWREAEHCRTHVMGNFLLTVIYDLLVTEAQTAKIYDWKTYRQPLSKKRLEINWQTRLYLYVLAETSAYLPEQISMTYWFVRARPPRRTRRLVSPVKSANPRSQTIIYSQAQHQKNQQDLTYLLENLALWLSTEKPGSVSFPHHHSCQQQCPFYKILGVKATESDRQKQELLDSIAEIEEVDLNS